MSDEAVRARIKAAYDAVQAGEPTVDLGDFSKFLPHKAIIDEITAEHIKIDGMLNDTIAWVVSLAASAIGRQIAYRIRAELVCCNIFQRVQDGEVSMGRMGGSHVLCYWGEAAARIAENPEQWETDPHNHDWSAPISWSEGERGSAVSGHRKWSEVKASMNFTPEEQEFIAQEQDRLNREILEYRKAHPDELLRNAAEGARAFGEQKGTKLPGLLADWLEVTAAEMEEFTAVEYAGDSFATWDAAIKTAWEILEFWEP